MRAITSLTMDRDAHTGLCHLGLMRCKNCRLQTSSKSTVNFTTEKVQPYQRIYCKLNIISVLQIVHKKRLADQAEEDVQQDMIQHLAPNCAKP
jgi:hypothetical protein